MDCSRFHQSEVIALSSCQRQACSHQSGGGGGGAWKELGCIDEAGLSTGEKSSSAAAQRHARRAAARSGLTKPAAIRVCERQQGFGKALLACCKSAPGAATSGSTSKAKECA